MNGDPGLTAAPWVRIQRRGGSVSVDGVPVPGRGTVEDRYLAALQQVAAEIAGPVGRRVGVTVTDGRGLVSHLAVHPDGTVDSIEELVRAAHAPVIGTRQAGRRADGTRQAGRRAVRTRPAERGAGPTRPVRWPARRAAPGVWVGSRRRLAIVSAVIAVAAVAVVAAPLLDGGSGETAASSIGAPRSDPPASVASGATAEARQVLAGPQLQARVRLSGRASSPAPETFALTLSPTPRSLRATVRVVTSDGRVVVRRVRLTPGSRARLVLVGLAPGTARWSVRARDAEPARGRLWVRSAPVPEPVVTPPTPPPAPQGGGGADQPSGEPTGPIVPIDPDDL